MIVTVRFCSGVQNGGLAQLARASALHAEGHRFDSDILHNMPVWRNDNCTVIRRPVILERWCIRNGHRVGNQSLHRHLIGLETFTYG